MMKKSRCCSSCRKLSKSLLFLAVLSLLAQRSTGLAAEHIVPDDFPVIQAAIDFAQDGDEIHVRAGVYLENLVILGKSLRITSFDGPEVTILDGSAPSSPEELNVVFVMASYEFVLDGFTVRYGDSRLGLDGGGLHLLVIGQDSVIRNCWIVWNQAARGGGIFLSQASPLIEDCLIQNNEASHGGGIAVRQLSAPLISRTLIAGNTATGGGGGILLGGAARIEQCSILRNRGRQGAGVAIGSMTGTPSVSQTIIAFSLGDGLAIEGTSVLVEVACCDIFGNEAGDEWHGADLGDNFSLDPLLCESDWLQPGSPCEAEYSPGECGQIGAYGIGCEPHPVRPATWGMVKSSFR